MAKKFSWVQQLHSSIWWVAFVWSGAIATAAIASDTRLETHTPEFNRLAQVTNVSELADVLPGDWAYVALQRLVEDYGCLEGYPQRLFQGSRALTRDEFAAGLNACLDVVVQVIANEPDLDTLRRLQDEFAVEMARASEQVNRLEADVAQLRANQFSTTTKLSGSLTSHLVVPFGDAVSVVDRVQSQNPDTPPNATDGIVGGREADATFEYSSQLNLDTSFTGYDRLRISLTASDAAGSLANSESGLNAVIGGSPQNSIYLNDVYYRFPVGNVISGTVAANGVAIEDFVSSAIVPFGGEAIAAAGRPEFYDLYAGGNFGAGANVELSNSLVLDLAYLSDVSNENTDSRGLFNNYSYVAQLNLLTDGLIDAAVVYLDGDQRSDLRGSASLLPATVRPEYTLAGLVSLDFGRFVLAGHYARSPANGIEGNLDSYMGGVAFPGLFGEGNELGIYGGISPAINRDPLLIEAYYQLNVNEYFTFTPALIYTDSGSGSSGDTTVYGAVRATFSF